MNSNSWRSRESSGTGYVRAILVRATLVLYARSYIRCTGTYVTIPCNTQEAQGRLHHASLGANAP